MRRPRKTNFRKSKRMFSRTAAKSHRKNSLRSNNIMRGGIRL